MPEQKNELADFESNLDKLTDIIDEMESGKLSLEDSLKKFEQGVKLTNQCQNALKTAEQTVKQLVDKQGETELINFDVSDQE